MNRILLQKLASVRVHEARTLLMAGHYPGAYYLIGYAVECALKACISKQVKQYDFPDKKLAEKAYTHALEQLVKTAGLERDFIEDRQKNPELDLNWTVVKDWKETARYDPNISSQPANDLYSACTGANGVLPWIIKRW
jgi:HEPN domain-containing protein